MSEFVWRDLESDPPNNVEDCIYVSDGKQVFFAVLKDHDINYFLDNGFKKWCYVFMPSPPKILSEKIAELDITIKMICDSINRIKTHLEKLEKQMEKINEKD